MDRVTLLKVMNELILATTDEDVIDLWLQVIPEDVDAEDFQEIAEDEKLFCSVMALFIDLSKHFKEGLNLFGNWYFGEKR